MLFLLPFPRDPITLSKDDWGIQSPPKSEVFRFHETILRFGEPGSLGLLDDDNKIITPRGTVSAQAH